MERTKELANQSCKRGLNPEKQESVLFFRIQEMTEEICPEPDISHFLRRA